MSSVRRLVSPKLPTSLADHTHVDLPGQDVWLFYANGVQVVSAKLDVSKFEDALARVLQLYPHAAGQLRCIDGRWSIELTNSPVPLDIEYKPDMNSDSLLDGDWVVQDDLSPFLSQPPLGAKLVNGNAPLLRMKLVFFKHETSISISWNHSLGDAPVGWKFGHTLSRFYQGLPLGAEPMFSAPTFKKHHFSMSPHSIVASSLPLFPTDRFDESLCTDSLKDLVLVKGRIGTRDLEELRSALSSDKQNAKFISKQDCLAAYIVAVLNHNRSNPVKKVTNMHSYRHISAPFIDENVAGNLLVLASANIPRPIDMAAIATAVRNARIQSLEPTYIHILESWKSKHMLEAANARCPFPVLPDDDGLLVNSVASNLWSGAEFGYPDGARSYMDGMRKHFMRCFVPNPVKGNDGVWRTRQSIDFAIGVPTELKPKILETLARGVRYMFSQCQQARL